MATITEDYVSDETFKLLKENGFDDSCCRFVIESDETYYRGAPTLQMAMKWLREVHNLVIQIELIDFLEHGEIWVSYITERKTIKQLTAENFTENSYEEAAEAAIKYCLENLI